MGQLNTQNNEGIINEIIDNFINPLGIFAQNTAHSSIVLSGKSYDNRKDIILGVLSGTIEKVLFTNTTIISMLVKKSIAQILAGAIKEEKKG